MENVERLAAEAISNDESSLPWLRTQAQTTKEEEGEFVKLTFVL